MKHVLYALIYTFFAWSGFAQLPTKEELLESYFQAHGGKATLNAIKSVRISGVMSAEGAEQKQFTLTKKRPNKVRLAINGRDGKQHIISCDGEVVWEQFGNERPEDAKIIRDKRAQDFKLGSVFFGYLMDMDATNLEISDPIRVEMNGKTLYLLKVRLLEAGQQIDYYLDPKTSLEEKIVIHSTDAKGQPTEQTTYLSDYRSIGPLMEAFVAKTENNGQTGFTRTAEKFEVNVGVFSEVFNYPGRDELHSNVNAGAKDKL